MKSANQKRETETTNLAVEHKDCTRPAAVGEDSSSLAPDWLVDMVAAGATMGTDIGPEAEC